MGILSIAEASKIFVNLPFNQIFEGRRRFQEFLDEIVLDNGRLDHAAGKPSQDQKNIDALAYIRLFEKFFLTSYQISYAAPTQTVIPFFIAPFGLQLKLCRHFLKSENFSPNCIESVLMALGALQFCVKLITNILKIFLSIVLLPLFSSAVSRRQPNSYKALKNSVFWYGHPSSLSTDASKLSERIFLQKIATIREQRLPETTGNFIILNGSKEVKSTEHPSVFIAPKLFLLPTPLNFLLWLQTIAAALRLLVKKGPLELLPENMKTLLACYFLKTISPKSVVFTNSDYQGDSIQTAAKINSIQILFVYYSANNVTPQVGSETKVVETLAWKYNLADKHLVWDELFAKWFTEVNGIASSKIRVVGPIMFAEPDPKVKRGPHVEAIQPIRIGIFDVTPMNYAHSFSTGSGQGFYPSEDCHRFMRDVIAVISTVFGDNFYLILKLKRQPNLTQHVGEYISFQQKLLDELGQKVTLLAPDHNPWAALAMCNMVIGIPYTSLVDAALAASLDSIYYSPFRDKIICRYKKPETAINKESLEEWMMKVRDTPRKIFDSSKVHAACEALAMEICS